MSGKNKNIIGKENAVQAIVVADTFGNEFVPISNSIPLSLLPIVNKPIIDYTLEFLSLGGIEETFLFCCCHIEEVKTHISKSIENGAEWALTMKVNIIASKSCRSFGDCLRDLDAKGLLRGDFVLLEPGVLSNMQLLPLINKHNALTKIDKGTAMTLIFQEAGVGYFGRCPQEEVLIAANASNRVLFHKKMGKTREKKVTFPLEIFLENPVVSLHHNLKDTHIAICSPSVLPLFTDNFHLKSKDDFIGELLMNEDTLGSTVYCHIVKGDQFGGAVTNWRMYQALSRELIDGWIYPFVPCPKRNKILEDIKVVFCKGEEVGDKSKLLRTVLGQNVKIGKNVRIEESFVLANTTIEDNVIITHSVIGPNCIIKSKTQITAGSILGQGVVIDECVQNALVQSTKPEDCCEKDMLGKNAFRLKLDDEEDKVGNALAKKLSRLHIDDDDHPIEDDYAFSESDDDVLSYTESPVPDDTKLFFTEVIDSLTRGFEDGLPCDNLILEINSSRHAYNVTVKEVNFNVIKAILSMSLRQPIGPQYYSHFTRLLAYSAPVLKNYIRNEEAMSDSLEALQDVAMSSEKVNEKWLIIVLQYFYENDYILEDAILEWASDLDQQTTFFKHVRPFIAWLQEAEEASSSEESVD